MENKIDTQGMSTEGKLHFTAPPRPEQPFVPSVRSVFTDKEREELKDIITEALNEWWINK